MMRVKLIWAAVLTVWAIPVAGFGAEPSCTDANCTHKHHAVVRKAVCPKAGPAGFCKDPQCKICRSHAGKHHDNGKTVCPTHGENCPHPQDCLKNEYAYGRMEVCPGKTNGVCPVHGYGQCPHPNQGIGPFLRQAITPADRPYFGAQPLPYFVPREQYNPAYQPRFPRLRAMFVMPPGMDARYMTTTPPEQMNTYTTRGPRDFLMPNPPSIGY